MGAVIVVQPLYSKTRTSRHGRQRGLAKPPSGWSPGARLSRRLLDRCGRNVRQNEKPEGGLANQRRRPGRLDCHMRTFAAVALLGLASALPQYAETPDPVAVQARALLSTNQAEKAADLLEKAVAAKPNDAARHYL